MAPDGRPLVTPIWFIVEHGELLFNTGADTPKGRAIARDPRLVITVDVQEPPFAYVQVQGVATTDTDPDELIRVRLGDRRALHGRRPSRGVRPSQRRPRRADVRLRPTKVNADFDVTA